MTLDELRAAKRDVILDIARRHGVTSVRVFGSYARNEARQGSDLDLLIQAGSKTSPFFPGGFLSDLEDELGMRVDVVEEPALHPLLRDEILREAVPL
jgi:predicted nucleotidyltransferase